MRRCLTEDEYILMSSFYENVLAARADIWDIADFSRIRFVFGHYIHEGLLPLFQLKSIWDVFLFTGVRDPTLRAISQYYQLTKICQTDIAIQDFVDSYGCSMCDEIIRAFPSAVDTLKPKWQNAAEILTAFDYIYSADNYVDTIQPVYTSLGLSLPSMDELTTKHNSRLVELDPNIAAQITEAMLESDDLRLYSLVLPSIGMSGAGLLIAEQLNIETRREKILGSAVNLPAVDNDVILFKSLFDFMGYELHLLGDTTKKLFLERLKMKKYSIESMISYLETRVF